MTTENLPSVWVVWDGPDGNGIDVVFDTEAAALAYARETNNAGSPERFTLHAEPPAKVMRYRYTIKANGEFRVHGWQVDNDPNLADSLDNYSEGDLSLCTYVAGMTPDTVRATIDDMAERSRVASILLDGGA